MQNSKKLTKYLTGALALASGSAVADIVYVDVDPDHSVTIGHNTQQDEFFNIIIDNDTVMRVGNWNGYWSTGTFNGVWVENLENSYSTLGNAIVFNGTLAGGDTLADALNLGDIIDSNDDWNDWGNLGYNSTYSNGAGGAGLNGVFESTSDKYVGCRFNLNGNLHYGWMRFDVDTLYGGFTFKDYAYQDCPNVPIKAGESNSILANVLNLNTNQFGSGNLVEEVEYSFSLAQADTTVSEYRLMIVKAENAASFTASNAKMVNDSLVFNLDDSKVTHNDTLKTTDRDVDGDLLVSRPGGYRMFALSIPNGSNSNAIALSNQSDQFLASDLSIGDASEGLIITNNRGIVNLSSDEIIEGEVSIISVSGKVIISEVVNSKNHSVNINSFTKGMYIVNVLSENGKTYSKKIVL